MAAARQLVRVGITSLLGLSITHAAWAQLPDRYDDARQRLNTHVQANRVEPALALAESLQTDAQERDDPSSVAILLRMRGEILARYSRHREAAPLLGRAIEAAHAVRDTGTELRALFWRRTALGGLGRTDEADHANDRMFDLALAARDESYQAEAHALHAYARLNAGDFAGARDGYRNAVAHFEAAQNLHSLGNALIGLGRAQMNLGEDESARAALTRALAIADTTGNQWIAAHAHNNFGALEFLAGDPSTSIIHYRAAIEGHRIFDNHGDVVTSLVNIAIAHKHLTQYDDAMTVLSEARQICEDHGLRRRLAGIDVQAADIFSARGQPEAGAAACREVLSGPNDDLASRLDALLGLAGALAAMDSTAAAASLLERQHVTLRERIGAPRRARLDVDRARYLLGSLRPAEALRVATRAEQEAGSAGLSSQRLALATLTAQSQFALGRWNDALVSFERSAELWEQHRVVPSDSQWRVQRGSWGRQIFTRIVALTLDHGTGTTAERAARAFDAVQAYKTRTLQEQMHGRHVPQAPRFEPITLARLQRDVLETDEVLLDTYLGPDESMLFVVTREACEVVRLPGDQVLWQRALLARDLVSAIPTAEPDPSRARALNAAASSLRRMLLEPAARTMDQRGRIIFSPDGALGLLPLEWLLGTDETRMITVERIPSATLLATLRATRSTHDMGSISVMAIAGTRTESDEQLSGAFEEVRWLHRTFENVSVHDSPSRFTPDLAPAGILHLAAHTSLDDQHPWRSGLLLESGPEGGGVWLRASQIAELDLTMRLAFLSGCESASGRAVSGEGVQGLTGAFLTAGTPAVIATLWPVDDRATVGLVQEFYRGMEAGLAASEALAAARASMRGATHTSDPFYWAGFVLVGDGALQVDLKRRPNYLPFATAGAAVVLIAIWIARRRRRARPMSAGGRV